MIQATKNKAKSCSFLDTIRRCLCGRSAVWLERDGREIPVNTLETGQYTAIPLPIKMYVARRVGVAVILSPRPTPGTIEYSTNRFCGETYVLAGVLKSQVFKLCFGAKSFVLGEKLAKLRKEEDW